MQNRARQRKFREKHKSEIEKDNVIVTEDNAEEDTKDIENTQEDKTRKENENGFREYRI